MQQLYRTTVREVGTEAADLIAQGILILFAVGAPPELAEVSVLHESVEEPRTAPVAGDQLAIGGEAFRITAVGATAWAKMREIGHVVFSFTGAAEADRPGEICVTPRPEMDLMRLLAPGAAIVISR